VPDKRYLGLQNDDFQAINKILDALKIVDVGANTTLKVNIFSKIIFKIKLNFFFFYQQ